MNQLPPDPEIEGAASVPVPATYCQYEKNGELCGRKHPDTRLFVYAYCGEAYTFCGQHFFEILESLSAPMEGLDYDRQR